MVITWQFIIANRILKKFGYTKFLEVTKDHIILTLNKEQQHDMKLGYQEILNDALDEAIGEYCKVDLLVKSKIKEHGNGDLPSSMRTWWDTTIRFEKLIKVKDNVEPEYIKVTFNKVRFET